MLQILMAIHHASNHDAYIEPHMPRVFAIMCKLRIFVCRNAGGHQPCGCAVLVSRLIRIGGARPIYQDSEFPMLVSRGAQRNNKLQLERKVAGSAVVQKYLQVRVGVGLSLLKDKSQN